MFIPRKTFAQISCVMQKRVLVTLSGAIRASEAADAWATVLDRMEENWKMASGEIRTTTTPPLRVYMRLGSLYNTLGRTEDAKVEQVNHFAAAAVFWEKPEHIRLFRG